MGGRWHRADVSGSESDACLIGGLTVKSTDFMFSGALRGGP